MKISKIIASAAIAVLAVSVVACGDKKAKENENENIVSLEEAEAEFASTLNSTDTTEILAMGTAFMDSLKSGNIDAAVDMLYIFDEQGNLVPIDAKNRESLKQRYTTFPVVSYRLDHMDLSIPSLNDLKYVYQLSEDLNMPGMAVMFNPTKRDGKWYLMLKQENQPAKDAANALPEDAAVLMPEK